MTQKPFTTSYARIPSAFSGPQDQRGAYPILFQVMSPDGQTPLLPDYLYMHVNPAAIGFSYSKIINRIQTLGGFVEQHFGEQLIEISVSHTTGAFVHVGSGVTALNRKETIAYRKMQHLIDIFKSNGSVYDDKGRVQFKGGIRMVYSGGIYDGYFTNLSIEETGDKPFNLELSWGFKIVKESHQLVY